MLRFFKPIPFYLRVYRDRMVLRRVDTGATIEKKAVHSFSSDRMLLADFPNASVMLNAMVSGMSERVGPLQRKMHMVIHAMEMAEGGLSVVEMTAFKDLCEHAGAYRVKVLADEKVCSDPRVLQLLEAQ